MDHWSERAGQDPEDGAEQPSAGGARGDGDARGEGEGEGAGSGGGGRESGQRE